MIIDVASPYGPTITIEHRIFDKQWVEFYGRLALLRTNETSRDDFLDAAQLHRMGQWSGKQLASVGKEVARHCKKLERDGIALIESHGKTKLWRLVSAPESVEFRPSRGGVERWLRSRTRLPDIDERSVSQLEALVHAQVAVKIGEGAKAREQVRQLADFSSPELDAWAGLIDARSSDQYIDVSANPGALDALAEHWATRSDAAGRSVAARIIARVALRKRFIAPQEQYASLAKHAAEVERRGDIAGLAAVINVLGILATRLERPSEAAHHHLRAAALFGIVGDFNSLQGAVFNVANARVRARQLADAPPDRLSLRLLDVCTQICRVFSVGQESVQSEIAGAHWAMDMGDYVASRRYLEAGEALVARQDSAFEQGCYLFARARLELLDPSGVHNPIRDLKTARREFTLAGADGPLADVEQMLQRAEERNS